MQQSNSRRQPTAVKGSNAEPLSTKFTREDVGRIERHANEASDFNTVNGYSPL